MEILEHNVSFGQNRFTSRFSFSAADAGKSLLSIFSPSKYSLNNLLGALRNYKSKVGIQDKSLKSKFDVPDWKT